MKPTELRPSVVEEVVPHGLIGTYLLGEERESGQLIPRYVGRSDVNLRARLLKHARVGDYTWFAVLAAETIFEAYRLECRGWHLYPRLANVIHPGSPRNLPYLCPYCLARKEFATYLRRRA